ncbi:MAG: UDP-3-O-(3-hydroxymyristoyl)glucosamine N-acyltransferase [Rickettsiaceae bacterium]|nr:UDP-3-O-(3-hydroxymyristoyl)glucosamine N-acyltransferase [Rickettsiaceae bacterium]
MIDEKFYSKKLPRTLQEVADYLSCNIISPSCVNPREFVINSIAPIETAGAGDLTFLNNDKYESKLASSGASACIIKFGLSENLHKNMCFLESKEPYYSYAQSIDLFYAPKVSEPSSNPIHPSAVIGKNVKMGHHVVIGEGAEIGDGCEISHSSFIGAGVKIGKNARIGASVSIEYSIIGDNVVILSGARIGQDGFGFATSAGKHYKIFHLGRVLIGNDVEIGANTTIDRGSLNDTVIEDSVRIDNLVQIAHNVQIGTGSIIVAQAGIAGSSKIGKYCALGGQVGISGHITIADMVQIAGQGGAIQNIDQVGAILGGTPAVPIRDWHKQSIILKNLVKNRR